MTKNAVAPRKCYHFRRMFPNLSPEKGARVHALLRPVDLRMLCFLCDSWWLIPVPQHRFGLWSFDFSTSDHYEVSLQLLTIVRCSIVPCNFLDHTRPSQSEVEQNSVILTCKILPGSRLKAFRILWIVHSLILHRNAGHGLSANS